MELTLNLVWVVLAIWMVLQWARFAPRDATGRRKQIAALAVLILILLPAISVTDDLLAAQNPAECDNCLRRAHEFTIPHSIFPAVAVPPVPAFSWLSLGAPHVAASCDPSTASVQPPALASIQNRPPPAA